MRVHLVRPYTCFPHSFRRSSPVVVEIKNSLFDFPDLLYIVHSEITCLSDVYSSDTYGL
jgi:hypothetical protein